MALERGLTINIHLGDLLKQRKEVTPVEQPKETEADKLLVRLINKNEKDGEAMMKLSSDVLDYLDQQLKAGNMTAVKEFLKEENRATLTEDMKELVKDKLSAHKL